MIGWVGQTHAPREVSKALKNESPVTAPLFKRNDTLI